MQIGSAKNLESAAPPWFTRFQLAAAAPLPGEVPSRAYALRCAAATRLAEIGVS